MFDKTEVTAIRHEPEALTSADPAGHAVQARKLVIATGYDEPSLLRHEVARVRSSPWSANLTLPKCCGTKMH